MRFARRTERSVEVGVNLTLDGVDPLLEAAEVSERTEIFRHPRRRKARPSLTA